MKPIVLTFVRYYLPGFRSGGPIRTIDNLVERLGNEFEFRIVTQDRDHGDRNSYPGVQVNTWTPCGKGWVYYVSQNCLTLKKISKIIRDTPHDVIYLNSFFHSMFTGRVLVNRLLGRISRCPVILAPRGELSDGALAIKSIRKRAYIFISSLLRLYSNIIWQASSEYESNDIINLQLRLGYGVDKNQIKVSGNLIVAPDMAAHGGIPDVLPSTDESDERSDRRLRICFLSRVCEIKNLTYALNVLSQVRVPVEFSIYGPTEDSKYWARCQALIVALPSHIEVNYKGVVEHAKVRQVFRQQDLFFLPTLGENFGHVIVEALLGGLPLLISDKTPWRSLEAYGVGWDLALDDPSVFARKIEEVASWRHDDFLQLAGNINKFVVQLQNDDSTLEANRNLFLGAINMKAKLRN